MKRFWEGFSRNDLWVVLPVLIAGLVLGIAFYRFATTKAVAYLSDRPEVCLHCHVMREPYERWRHSSHGGAVVCNECHTPHPWVGKTATKVSKGFQHTVRFVSGRYEKPIRIDDRGRKIAEENCRRCHQKEVLGEDKIHLKGSRVSCMECHEFPGHAELSAEEKK